MPQKEERIIRLDLTKLEKILKKASVIKEKEHLNDGHIEPNELVLRVLYDARKEI